jgi:hypothetical protein
MVDQVLERATESGQLGDHQGVALEEVVEGLGQPGAGGVGVQRVLGV